MTFYVSKGDREKWKDFAKEHGMSMNEFCNKALRMFAMELEGKEE